MDHGERPAGPRSVWAAWGGRRGSCGWPSRVTLATALKSAEVPDHRAAALLGHDVQTFTRFYLVTDDAGAAEAAEVAGRLFAV